MEDLSKYKGNSRKTSDEPLPSDKPRIGRVTTTLPRIRKKSAWARIRTTFFEEDARTIGQAVIEDVIVPKLKDLFFDVVTEGTHRSLYSSGSDRRPSRLGGGRTNYSQYSRPGTSSRIRREEREERRPLEHRERAMHDFSGITFPNAGEAEAVADKLIEHVNEYGLATVADFYDAIGITAEFTDDAYGWTDLRRVVVRKVRDGYILNLPRPEQLDNNENR